MVEGLLDGPAKLREVCRVFLANSDVCLEPAKLADMIDPGRPEPSEPNPDRDDERSEEEIAVAAHSAAIESARKRRHGLPEGYVPRLHKH